MNTQSRRPATQAEMHLARLRVDLEGLEINLNLIVGYAKITHTTLIEVKAKQCLMDIEENKQQLNTPNQI